jgi:hypothetical protein
MHAFRMSVIAGALASSSCASQPLPPPAPLPVAAAPAPKHALQAEFADAPKWFAMGCGAFFGEKKTLVCGVGLAAGMTNPAMARSAAQGRGRTEIARSLQMRVKAMLKDHQSATQGGPGNKTSSEQHLEDTSKQVTDLTLSGTRLQDSWISPSGTFCALMVLDVNAFKDSLKEMRQLDEQVREAIVQRAERAFAELDAETEGRAPAAAAGEPLVQQ